MDGDLVINDSDHVRYTCNEIKVALKSRTHSKLFYLKYLSLGKKIVLLACSLISLAGFGSLSVVEDPWFCVDRVCTDPY